MIGARQVIRKLNKVVITENIQEGTLLDLVNLMQDRVKKAGFVPDYYSKSFANSNGLISLGAEYISTHTKDTIGLDTLQLVNFQGDKSDVKYMNACDSVCRSLLGVGFGGRGKSGLSFNKFVDILPIRFRVSGKMIHGKFGVSLDVFLDKRGLVGLTEIPANVDRFLNALPKIASSIVAKLRST